MNKTNKYRIVNYPQDISGCHDLIRLLVEELNATCENKREQSATPADDNKYQMGFSVPSGCNGGGPSQNQSVAEDGGVRFMNFRGCGITPASAE